MALWAEAHVGDELLGAVAVHLVEVGDVVQVLGHVQVGVERILLGQVAQNAAHFEAVGGAIHSVNVGGTFVSRNQSAHNFHESRLARAVRAEQAVDLSGLGV